MKFGMDGKMETIPTMFVPLDFLNAVVYPSISKPIEEVWDNIVAYDVKKAKDNGLNDIYHLANSEDFNREKYVDYQIVDLNEDLLNKMLKGEIKSLEELKNKQMQLRETMDSYEFQVSMIYSVLHFTKKEEKGNKIITMVDSIFIK